MSHTFSRSVIRGQWRFVHCCQNLSDLFEPYDPIDSSTVAIIFGHDSRWYVRDKSHDSFFPVHYCPGCGIELIEQFSALETLGRLDSSVIARMPEKKGLEG